MPLMTRALRCTIDVDILEQESHRQTQMKILDGIKSTEHGNSGRNICLFT
jgi:hypothetical protein